MNRFEGKVALNTRSSAGTALDMADEGADIIIHYNTGRARAEEM